MKKRVYPYRVLFIRWGFKPSAHYGDSDRIWVACGRCQFALILTFILVHIFLWLKDENDRWRCSNWIFKRKSCQNKNVQIWCIWALTSLCSQGNSAYRLNNVFIFHSPLNTKNDVRVNLCQCLLKQVITRYFSEYTIYPLHMSR